MSNIADPIAAIRAILLNDATVAGLVSTRIFGEIDEDEAKLMPRADIVLQPSGGPGSPGGGYQHYGKQRIDVHCYGENLYESYLLSLAAHAALKSAKRQISEGVLIYSADPQSKSATARRPDTQWPVTYSSWLVLYGETAAA